MAEQIYTTATISPGGAPAITVIRDGVRVTGPPLFGARREVGELKSKGRPGVAR